MVKIKEIIIIILTLAVLLMAYDSLRYRESNNFLNTELNNLKIENSEFDTEIKRLEEEISDYDDNVNELLNERKKLVDSYDSIINNIEEYDRKNRRNNTDINVDSLRSFLSDYKY